MNKKMLLLYLTTLASQLTSSWGSVVAVYQIRQKGSTNTTSLGKNTMSAGFPDHYNTVLN